MYIRETARRGAGGASGQADTTRVVTFAGGDGAALPQGGTMSREFTEVFGYIGRQGFRFLMFPYRIGRRVGGGLRGKPSWDERNSFIR